MSIFFQKRITKRSIQFLIVSVIASVTVSCHQLFKNTYNDQVIAKAAGNQLTLSQLQMAVPANMKEIDSISFAQNYIEKWVKDQLMLEKAELNLSRKTQREIGNMIESYRTSLMIFKYQQMLINQKLDTVVTEEQITDYYKTHAGNFRLDNAVVKAIYVKLPKAIHDRYRVRTLIRSSREDDMITLEDYCYQNARTFYMGEEWLYLSDLLSDMPNKINAYDHFLKYNRYLETSDSIYAYYMYVLDYRLTNDTTPQKFVTAQIKDILINHRKVDLIRNLENNLYNDAVNHKKFSINTY